MPFLLHIIPTAKSNYNPFLILSLSKLHIRIPTYPFLTFNAPQRVPKIKEPQSGDFRILNLQTCSSQITQHQLFNKQVKPRYFSPLPLYPTFFRSVHPTNPVSLLCFSPVRSSSFDEPEKTSTN